MKKKFVAGVMVTMLALASVGSAYAFSVSYNASLPMFGGHATIASVVADRATVGTYTKAKCSTYAGSWQWQDGHLPNGTQQVSPSVLVSSSVTTWLGFWNGYTLKNGQLIDLRGCAKDWVGDTISGSWWY